jgi:hypothetical protein
MTFKYVIRDRDEETVFDWCGFPIEVDDTVYEESGRAYCSESSLNVATLRDEEDDEDD